MKQYNHKEIEAKWQALWNERETYRTSVSNGKNSTSINKKKYVLDMFPYPSGATMHVGHLEGYVATDILTRYFRMLGHTVLHPMGWDAFGLPAENYAIKTGIHPDISIKDNIHNFKRQLATSGLSYDWSKEIDTSSPEFYKWTQWLFIELFKKGLAYKKKSPVNYCPKDETVLANEQVIDGKCERCDTEVIQKELDQWFFKITAYADKLIDGLKDIDWPDEVKRQQINWIGRSHGMTLDFKIDGESTVLKVFTTRPDTLESVTFVAVSAGDRIAQRSEEKTGSFTGKYAINPLNNRKVPIWETNYVASDYGTGAIMGVPGYDERDRDFAKKYKIDIVENPFNEDIEKIAEENGWGKKETNYHLRDWLISRQRYWGAPIPMTYCEACAKSCSVLNNDVNESMAGWFPVKTEELPVLLPRDVDFLPHGESPVARSKTFQKDVVCSNCGGPAKREVDTMDTYVDSSWYFIRFTDPNNPTQFASKEAMESWLPVDNYVGGGHVVQHLLFARFFWKFLLDSNLIPKSLGIEPFLKLRAPGWILGPDSRKMSKRWGNVITPDDIIPKFGADTLRVYEMFMGPFDVMKPWSITGVEGISRFLARLYRILNETPKEKDYPDVIIKLHQTIKKVTTDLDLYKFNTCISTLMEFTNILNAKGGSKQTYIAITKLLAPFAPHLAEEIWVETLGQEFSVHTSDWPKYDEKALKVDQTRIIVQVNGKMRSEIVVDNQTSQDQEKIKTLSEKDPNVSKWLTGQSVKKVIFVPGKIINFVI